MIYYVTYTANERGRSRGGGVRGGGGGVRVTGKGLLSQTVPPVGSQWLSAWREN